MHWHFVKGNCILFLDEPEEALLRSQAGPLASVPFTSLPTFRETTFAPQLLLVAPVPVPSFAPSFFLLSAR